MNTSYSIPETAKLTGIPEHAIREYAKQFADVLPAPETYEGGRGAVRRYPDAALAIFRSIRKLKDDGFDAAQIRIALHTPRPADSEEAARDAAVALIEGEPEWKEERAETASLLEESTAESLCLEMVEESVVTAEAAVEACLEAAPEAGIEAIAEEEATIEIEAVAEEEATIEIEAAEEAAPESESLAVSAETPAEELSEGPVAPPAEESIAEEIVGAASADAEPPIEQAYAAEELVEILEETVAAPSTGTAAFHPLFTNLNDGLKQLRKIMDENTDERESLRGEREQLLAETAAKQTEIELLTATVASQAEKIGGLQTALSALMGQCDQQLQAIRSALGQG